LQCPQTLAKLAHRSFNPKTRIYQRASAPTDTRLSFDLSSQIKQLIRATSQCLDGCWVDT